MNTPTLTKEVFELLKSLIATQSFSREEDKTGDLLEQFLQNHGVSTQRKKHNIWAKNLHFDPKKPVILLNSHHDTVRPTKATHAIRFRQT